MRAVIFEKFEDLFPRCSELIAGATSFIGFRAHRVHAATEKAPLITRLERPRTAEGATAPAHALAKQTAATIAIALRFCGAFGSLMSASSETVGSVL